MEATTREAARWWIWRQVPADWNHKALKPVNGSAFCGPNEPALYDPPHFCHRAQYKKVLLSWFDFNFNPFIESFLHYSNSFFILLLLLLLHLLSFSPPSFDSLLFLSAVSSFFSPSSLPFPFIFLEVGYLTCRARIGRRRPSRIDPFSKNSFKLYLLHTGKESYDLSILRLLCHSWIFFLFYSVSFGTSVSIYDIRLFVCKAMRLYMR